LQAPLRLRTGIRAGISASLGLLNKLNHLVGSDSARVLFDTAGPVNLYIIQLREFTQTEVQSESTL
jgi:hypothetical protein